MLYFYGIKSVSIPPMQKLFLYYSFPYYICVNNKINSYIFFIIYIFTYKYV